MLILYNWQKSRTLYSTIGGNIEYYTVKLEEIKNIILYNWQKSRTLYCTIGGNIELHTVQLAEI
jgi:hypothetical protein